MTVPAALLNTPTDQPSWDQWAFNFQAQIVEINAAILSQKKVSLPSYQLNPIPFYALDQWLERMSNALSGITGTLGLQSADVENVDLEDPAARQSWIWNVYHQVNSARQALTI